MSSRAGRGYPTKLPDEATFSRAFAEFAQSHLAEMQGDLPRACDRGTKCNAQGYKVSWNGYKLRLDTVDCCVPVAAIPFSASMHDSQAAIPLSRLTAARVTNLYDVMDAAYCSAELWAHCKDLGHVPRVTLTRAAARKLNSIPPKPCATTSARWRNGCPMGYCFA